MGEEKEKLHVLTGYVIILVWLKFTALQISEVFSVSNMPILGIFMKQVDHTV